MKKRLALVMCIILALTAMLPLSALAAPGDIELAVTAPVAMDAQGGSATVEMQIINRGGSSLSDVRVALPGNRGVFAPVSPEAVIGTNQMIKAELTITVSPDEIGKPLMFWLSGNAGGSLSSAVATVVIEDAATYTGEYPQPESEAPDSSPTHFDISENIVYSSLVADDSGTVYLWATLKNTGNVYLDDVQLWMPPVLAKDNENEDYVTGAVRIEAGDTVVVQGSFQLDATATVTPVITYTWAGQHFDEELTPVTFYTQSSELSATMTVASNTPAPLEADEVTLTIKNSGASAISGLRVQDSTGMSIPLSATSVPAGQSIEVKYAASFVSQQDYFVTVEGFANESGMAARTPSVTIAPALTQDTLGLAFDVTADNAALTDPGTVTVTVNVTSAAYDLYDYTAAGPEGELGSATSLKKGETLTYTYQTEVYEGTDLGFTFAATDIFGARQELERELTVTVANPRPEQQEVTLSSGKKVQLGTLGTVLIAAAAVLLVIIIVLVIVWIRMPRKYERK